MKPGEMTLDQLLDALEIVSQEIERRSDRANEANGAYVEHAAIRAELLARLNAGGSLTMVHMPPLGTTAGTHKLKEDAAAEVPPEEVAGIGHAEASEPLQPAVIRGGTPQPEATKPPCHVCGEPMKVKEWKCACGATTGCSDQPLQPGCPGCGSAEIKLTGRACAFEDGVQIGVRCPKCDFKSIPKSLADFAQFFRLSTPLAMPAPLEHIFAGRFDENWTREQEDELLTKMLARRASPQLEQVAREIAEKSCEHFADGCRADYVNRFTAQNLAILQRHFPGSEGAQATRFEEFDDAEHPANKWWQKHGQFMMSGGGRRQFIWACRGWIAREQLLAGVEVTGDSLHEGAASPPVAAAEEQAEFICSKCKAAVERRGEFKLWYHYNWSLMCEDAEALRAASLTPRKEPTLYELRRDNWIGHG